ncbi:DUF1801 domain-containing protein [Streptacidiphilus sp. MAP5-3]|uniref:DUF1801 domain-containing protein n=1 Tax=unclassified Streptacidiphilus TaxID=2643834 RepID=UPI003512083C
MDKAVSDYIDAIPAEQRPLFDRIHGLILTACPDADVVLSYDMPTYQVGKRRIHVGVWQHGVSLYGWRRAQQTGFVEGHPELLHGKATLRLRPEDAAGMSDDELRTFLAAALGD